LENYADILSDPDVWHSMQVTAHFVVWTIVLQMLLGLGSALLINRKFRGHAFWTTVILLPMMLSPRGGQQLLDVPVPAADRPGAPDDRPRGYLDMDALRHADLFGRPALDPRGHL